MNAASPNIAAKRQRPNMGRSSSSFARLVAPLVPKTTRFVNRETSEATSSASDVDVASSLDAPVVRRAQHVIIQTPQELANTAAEPKQSLWQRIRIASHRYLCGSD